MQFHIIRCGKGSTRGLAVTWKKAMILPVVPGKPPVEPLERTCERCFGSDPIVFCRTHGRYLCESCIRFHNQAQECSYLSLAAFDLRKGA